MCKVSVAFMLSGFEFGLLIEIVFVGLWDQDMIKGEWRDGGNMWIRSGGVISSSGRVT